MLWNYEIYSNVIHKPELPKLSFMNLEKCPFWYFTLWFWIGYENLFDSKMFSAIWENVLLNLMIMLINLRRIWLFKLLIK